MMGAPCARHVAEAGHKVALVAAPEPPDRRQAVGPFASHHDAARITRRVATDGDWSLLSCRSIERYADLERRSARRIFRDVGAAMAGPAEGRMADFKSAFHATARALAAPRPEMLDAEGAARRLGFALPRGSVVAHEAEAAGWIDPREMREAQVALAVQAGATLFAEPAVALHERTVTLRTGARLSGGEVVVATGPHAATDGLLPYVRACGSGRARSPSRWCRNARGRGSPRCLRSSGCRRGGTTTSTSSRPCATRTDSSG